MRLLLNCVTASLHLRFSGSVLRTDLPNQQLRRPALYVIFQAFCAEGLCYALSYC